MKDGGIIWQFYRGDILKLIFRRSMAEKRKSVFKHPDTGGIDHLPPAPDLLSPHLPGPELFISPPMSAIQTRPAFSIARFDSSTE